MKVTFWGTRGSIPTVTKQTNIYGGNTPCVTLEEGGRIVILDAGSGIRALSDSGILDQYDELDILLTHLHMDHVQGLGFFAPFFVPGRKVRIWGPSGPSHLVDRLTKYLSPPLFPVRIRDFRCDLTILDVPMKPFEVGGFEISATYICHPGPTLGFRATSKGRSVTFVPDHEPAIATRDFPGEPEWTSGYPIIKDTDLLIHDAQFSDEEYAQRQGWGHSTFKHALAIAKLCNAKKLALFHHDPAHSDQMLEKLYHDNQCGQQDIPVILAEEGTSLIV